MLHYVHQLVSNCVCLLFAAGQGEYRGFIGAFSLKTVKLVQPNQNNELKTVEHFTVLRVTAVGGNSLWVCHDDFLHNT